MVTSPYDDFMEEEQKEEEETESAPDQTSGEEAEEGEVEETDFKKEAEELEKKEERTELEKAERSLHFNAERVRQLGGDPSKIVHPTEKKEEEFVTKEDFAQNYAGTITKSPEELKVVMWHYKNSIKRTGNINEDINTAYLIAHKGKISRTFEEIQRAERPQRPSGGPGRSTEKGKKQRQAQEQESVLRRRGFVFNEKTGEYEAKFNKVVFNPSTGQWITVKK